MKRYFTAALISLILGLTAAVFGQEQEDAADTQTNTQKTVQEEGDSRAVRSFSNAVAWSPRNRLGLSLSASEGRISNVFSNSNENNSSLLSAFSGSVFANFGRRKSRLHMDYGAGYRMYNTQRNMDGGDHYIDVNYTYVANRKIKIQLSDIVSSSLNDPYSSFSPALRTTIDWSPSPSYDVIFLSHRILRNEARVQIDFDFARKTHFSVYGAGNIYRYKNQAYSNADTVQVGAGLDQRITNWLVLSSSYSTYLNNVDERLPDYKIHRLEAGRFRFMLSRNMELFASGGVEVADLRGDTRTEGMFWGGISRSSEKNVVYANYQRTMTSALGYSRILPSDVVTLGFGQRFNPRTNLRLSSSYTRSSDFDYKGLLKGYGAQAQFEYALASSLFASCNYSYQYQKSTINVLASIPHFDRSVVFLRLQFAWPSIRLKSE
jgi:hypothetical protein